MRYDINAKCIILMFKEIKNRSMSEIAFHF